VRVAYHNSLGSELCKVEAHFVIWILSFSSEVLRILEKKHFVVDCLFKATFVSLIWVGILQT